METIRTNIIIQALSHNVNFWPVNHIRRHYMQMFVIWGTSLRPIFQFVSPKGNLGPSSLSDASSTQTQAVIVVVFRYF